MTSAATTIHKTYRYALRLTNSPADKRLRRRLLQAAGCCRKVYNMGLAVCEKAYQTDQTSFSEADLCSLLPSWKTLPAFAYLNEAPASCLQQAMKNLKTAYDRFFKQQAKHPVYKKRGDRDAFRFPGGSEIQLDQKDAQIKLGKFGWIRYHQDRKIPSTQTIRQVTVCRQGIRWFVNILTSKDRVIPDHLSTTSVGIDLGVINFASLHFPAQNGVRPEPTQTPGLNFDKERKAIGKLARAIAKKERLRKKKQKQERERLAAAQKQAPLTAPAAQAASVSSIALPALSTATSSAVDLAMRRVITPKVKKSKAITQTTTHETLAGVAEPNKPQALTIEQQAQLAAKQLAQAKADQEKALLKAKRLVRQQNHAVSVTQGLIDKMHQRQANPLFIQPKSNKQLKLEVRKLRLEQKIVHKRNDFLHKLSTDLSKNHALIIVEDLSIQAMTASASGTIDAPGVGVQRKSDLNRRIMDQSWGRFLDQLEYKQAWRGGELLRVPPYHTSCICPKCQYVGDKNRSSQAVFLCLKCGHKGHADVIAAENIYERGLKIHGMPTQDRPVMVKIKRSKVKKEVVVTEDDIPF